MDTNFKGAFLTTEASVSYYNKIHIKNTKIVVRPTSDRVLLMVNTIFTENLLTSNSNNATTISADVHLF